MQLTFRTKLLLIAGTTALGTLLVVGVNVVTSRRVSQELERIEARYLPILELAPQLEADLERIRRGFQDAVAAQDNEALDATKKVKDAFLERLDRAKDVLNPSNVALLHAAFDDYYQSAYDVSQRMVGGETGEGIVERAAQMQTKYAKALQQLKRTTALDRRDLANAFDTVRSAQSSAELTRLVIGVLSLAFVLGLALWISRGMLRSLTELGSGFLRFGSGDFHVPMRVLTSDELGEAAMQANRMAERLRENAEQRRAADWLMAGQAGLLAELQGELSPEEVARKGVRFLAHHVEAAAAALYLAQEGDGARLELAADYALSGYRPEEKPIASFRPGEGLVGEAALQDRVLVVRDPPRDYLRIRSGLGDAPPTALLFLPILHLDKVMAVVELAFLKPTTPELTELLRSVQGTLAIAIEVARARAAAKTMLLETQRQAAQLAKQEEDLRLANEELQAQQEELKQTNEELTEQTHELEAQQRILEERHAELEDVRRRLEQKAEELMTVSTYKTRFLTNMSHELRTPLNSMLLLSTMLAENEAGTLTEKQVEYAKTIHMAGQDLLALINQLLDLAKIESGKHSIRIDAVRLEDVVSHMASVYTPLAKKKGLNLTIDLAPNLPESIATDRQRLEQILTNLIGNAIKFTEAGEVVLKVGRPSAGAYITRRDLLLGRAIAVSVSDTGIGIGPEDQERIFAPFEQADSGTERKYGGTGLGLSISRELAVLLGGELSLRSARGQGSTFTLFLPDTAPADIASTPKLPAAEPPAKASVEATSAGAATGPRATGTGGPPLNEGTILVIEDDLMFAERIAEIAAEQGLHAVFAKNGEIGLKLARAHKPRGIVLDVRLPDIDGFLVMESLRKDAETSRIPVHFISGIDAKERGLALGAIGYLTKPAARDDLVRVIEALTTASAKPRRLLIVEDDTVLGTSLVDMLKGHKIEAIRVGSSGEAMNALRADRFRCMILDLGLPDIDGLDFLEALHKNGDVEFPPVIVYTGRALSRTEVQHLESYAESVVMKEGASIERLFEEVRIFMDRLRTAPSRHAAIQSRARASHIAGTKLLVADDDMRTVYALSALLEAKGAEVLVADNGKIALQQLSENPDVDLVLMDIMMPEMDGYETMRRIREDPRFAELPIIALTAKAMKSDRGQAIAAGASDYMTKPLDGDRLLSLLQAWLAPSTPDGTRRSE